MLQSAQSKAPIGRLAFPGEAKTMRRPEARGRLRTSRQACAPGTACYHPSTREQRAGDPGAVPLQMQRLRGGPGKVFFAEEDLQHAFGGENVDGEATFPKCDTYQQIAAAAKVEKFAGEAQLQDFFVGGGHGRLGMQQAHAGLLKDGAWREAVIFNSQGDARLARVPK